MENRLHNFEKSVPVLKAEKDLFHHLAHIRSVRNDLSVFRPGKFDVLDND